MNIYVDDLRLRPDQFDLLFKSGEHLLEFLDDNPGFEIEWLSLDHDLGHHLMTGYDLTKKLVDRIQDGTLSIKKISFHTANPTGHKNMIAYMENAQKFIKFDTYIDTQFYGFN